MKPYRVIFSLAAVYNLAFGIWAGLFPLAFFRLFHLAPPRYPSIWSCVGMVVGLYGVAYAHVAWKPDRGTVIVWIGLAGKVLGPIGWLLAVGRGELPPRTFPLTLANDLIWWFPFLFYLLDRVSQRRAAMAWLCVAIHVVACLALLVVRGGTEAVGDMSERQSWVSQWTPIWTAAWLIWALASMSLLAFVVVWSERLIEMGADKHWVVTGCLFCAVGLMFDLPGETVNITWLTRPGQTVEDFTRGARLYALLGAVTANGLYCSAGLLLSVTAWRVGFARGWLGMIGFAMWTVGVLLSTAAVVDQRQAMVVTGGALMILFIPWAALIGWRLRKPQYPGGVH